MNNFYVIWYSSYSLMFLAIITLILLLLLIIFFCSKIALKHFNGNNKRELMLWKFSITIIFILSSSSFYFNHTLYEKAHQIYFDQQEPIYSCGLITASLYKHSKSGSPITYDYHFHLMNKKTLILHKFHDKLKMSPYSQKTDKSQPIINNKRLCVHYKKRPTNLFLTEYKIIIIDIFPTH